MGYRLSASYPMHRIAEFIDERINPKVLLEQISPGLTWGLGVRVLTEKSKHSTGSQPLRPRCQQAEITHGMPVSVQNVGRE